MLAALAFFVSYNQIARDFRARNRTERILRSFLMVAAGIAILTTIGILLSLIGETLNFTIGVLDWRVDKFLFGTTWSPLSGVHSGEMSADKVGAIPLFAGTAMITLIAMLVAVPIGLFAAIYLSDFAPKSVRSWAKPMLEILAGVRRWSTASSPPSRSRPSSGTRVKPSGSTSPLSRRWPRAS